MMHVIIPARGGSKGIPNKNLQIVGGKSLLARAIDTLHEARMIDTVFVSSDSPDILKVAEECGATPILRPAELSLDESSSEAALLHAIEEIARTSGDNHPYMGFFQCTNPFVTAEEIDGCVELLETGDFNSAFTAVPDHGFYWTADDSGTGAMVGVNHDHRLPRKRRQDLKAVYREDGGFYCFDVEKFKKAKTRFIEPIALHPCERIHFEIDEPVDLATAEKLLANA